MLKTAVSKAAASEGTRRTLGGYVEGLNNARTPLADFFSILLELPLQGGPVSLHIMRACESLTCEVPVETTETLILLSVIVTL
jgi:hypothetical protein